MKELTPASRIFVAGHRGLVGSALVRTLRSRGFERVLTRSRSELDLRDGRAVNAFFERERPEYVFLAAAKVGGIHANRTYPVDFLRDNLLIQTHLLEAAKQYEVQKLLFLGSSCIYPKHCPQPMREEHLLSGYLEPTNEAYAIAKISGLLACKFYNAQFGTRFIGAMPTNLYGPNDNFDLQSSHVVPAMIRKFHEAKQAGAREVELWGTGTPRRELLYVDDLADACLFLMDHFDPTPEQYFVNVGVGEDLTIAELAETVARVVGYTGELRWNTEMPDGTPRKLLDVSRISALGWKAKTGLEVGLGRAYEWYGGSGEARS